MDLGLFPSNKQLAAALGIDHSNVGKSLALARLPDTVVGAFRSPLDIQLRWAPLLNKALETDAQGVLARAQALALKAPRPSAKDVLAALVSGQEGLEVQARPHALQVAGKKAATLTFDADGRATIRIHLPLADAKRQRLQELLEEFMAAL